MTERTSDSRRILLVMMSLDVGGTELQVATLAGELARRGWNVALLSVTGPGPLSRELAAAGIELLDGGVRPGVSRAVRLAALGRCQLRVARHMAQRRPRVVHAFLPLPNLLTALAGRVLRAPVVVTSRRGLGTHQDRHRIAVWTDRATNALSDVVTANTRAVALDIERRDNYPADKVVVIANGLDFSRFDPARPRRRQVRDDLGLRPEQRALVFVANLLPYKGHVELIDAMGLLAKDRPELELFLIGADRGIGKALAAQAERHGITDRVHFLGQRDRVPELLEGMDVGVMASHEEGLSNALLEKLAAGLPVVATDVGGSSGAIAGMPGCELVRPRDAADLARGIRAVLAGPVDAAAVEERRRIMHARFSIPAMVDAYEQLYERGTAAPTGGSEARA